MKTSKSFSTKLFEAMKNDNKANRDPNLINEAVQCDFYHEASQLIIKDFPSTIPIPKILIDKIYSLIDANQEDFYSLILTLILQYDRFYDEIFDSTYFLREIPPKNINFALVISCYRARYYKSLDIVNSQITHFIPDSSKLASNSSFLSVKILQVQFFDFLSEKSANLHLKQATPSREFIFAEDRGKMSSTAEQLSKICVSYIDSRNDDQFYQSISGILNEFSKTFSKIIEKGKKHSISMIVRENSLFFVGGISKAAKKISENYIKKAIDTNSENITTMLQDIQDNVIQKKTMNYQESIILAELIALLFKKQDRPIKFQKYDEILTKFNTAILKFEKNFKEDKQFSPKYNNCITYPKKRNDYLLDEKTETSQALIILGKSLQYVKYITECSFIDSVMYLERCMVLEGMIDPDLTAKYEHDANIRFAHHFDINNKITKFLKDMKPFTLINPPLKDFQFNEIFPRYKFHPDFNLDNATITDIHQIFQQKVDLKEILPNSVLAMKIPKCLACHTIPVQRICGNCGKFVTCQKCASKGCPICHNALPDLS